MSSVVIAGDTSGTVTLQAPSVAGTTTLTLPSTSGTVTTKDTNGILSVNGIQFPATQSASADANCLDDYEEGTWTPGLTVAGVSFSSAAGKYIKIGYFVYVTWELNFPGTSNTSSFEVTGLPFTSNSYTGNVAITNYGSADLCFFVHASTSNIFVRNNSNSNLQLNAFSNKFVHGSAGYFI